MGNGAGEQGLAHLLMMGSSNLAILIFSTCFSISGIC